MKCLFILEGALLFKNTDLCGLTGKESGSSGNYERERGDRPREVSLLQPAPFRYGEKRRLSFKYQMCEMRRGCVRKDAP